ncbi:hypothetical protein AN478_11925 [Thiohalorhabdus denitrificans]|uniref:Kelch motif-containing protein n=1 Tax=Thiohalorhabdus denitrificans TaxID=381306 RepID=A0A0P9E9H7_9GAMM|nr:hypothetical protein [Thiohalorhabdus denitrificans]KPV39026.1 hypothetical protein AN478_11925 [Thiohalorhabdus denitrificans]SCX79662.1 hypothetical protein SAMN05661077_0478 [Thiohalorhabdus denitrificans]
MIRHKLRPTLYLLGPLLATALIASCGGDGSSGGSNDGTDDGSNGDNTSGVDIIAGTWVQQDPQADSGEPEYRPYSGVTAGDGRVFYWGGGHKSHDGNDIDAYEIVDTRWEQLTEEENTNDVVSWYEPDMSTEVSHAESQIGSTWARDWLASDRDQNDEEFFFGHELSQEERDVINEIAQIKYSQGGGHEVDILTPRDRPLSKHSYGQTAWWPGHGFCLLKQRLWCYDPEKGDEDDAWQELAQNPYTDDFNNAGSIHVWNLAYDPELDTLVTFYGAGFGRSGAYIYDPDAASGNGPWVSKPRRYMRTDGSWSQVYSAYNPNADEHIVYAGQQWQRVDLDTGEAREMAQLRNHPDMEGKLEQGPYGPVIRSFSMEWSPELDKALVAISIEGQLQLWAYDPEADAWERYQLENEGPVNAHAKWDTLARDPLTGVYVFLAKADENAHQTPTTWTFRIEAQEEAQEGEDGSQSGEQGTEEETSQEQ